MIYEQIQKLYDPACVKTAAFVGTGIHLYSTLANQEHFQGIIEDFSNERYIQGTLKAVFPFILPYAVSLYSRRNAQKEVKEKISKLEKEISDLTSNNQ